MPKLTINPTSKRVFISDDEQDVTSDFFEAVRLVVGMESALTVHAGNVPQFTIMVTSADKPEDAE